jgi:hypothetical protein
MKRKAALYIASGSSKQKSMCAAQSSMLAGATPRF